MKSSTSSAVSTMRDVLPEDRPIMGMTHAHAASRADLYLARALAGCGSSLGALLELYRNYLRLLAMGQLGRRLNARVSPSDVVQETFLEANQDFGGFRGRTSREFTAWLRQILLHNLHRVVDEHVRAQKRDVRREVSLEALAGDLERSSARLEEILPDVGPSPSVAMHRHDMEMALADALTTLPADYQTVIMLRHIEAQPFEVIAVRMGRSVGAVRMVWLRAIKLARERLEGVWKNE